MPQTPSVARRDSTVLAGDSDGFGGRRPAATAITDAEFERFRDFFYRRTGIHFADSKRYFVDGRLLACIEEAGETSFTAWFASLRLGIKPDLLQKLVNQLTVNETYFMREDYQFDCLLRSVLPEVLADRRLIGGPVKILSLPCSTGEEPYSIAIRLLEEWPPIETVDVEIHAADIDTNVLDAAREGRYCGRSVQRVPASWLVKHFTRDGDSCYRVSDDIRDAIDFSLVNVCDARAMRMLAGFDVIFCRNMLIYFDEVSTRQATENIYASLRPGGFLFLGHSESMSRISGIFTPRLFPDGIAYQRPKTGGA